MYIDASLCTWKSKFNCTSFMRIKAKNEEEQQIVVPVVASVVNWKSTGLVINCSSCLLGTEKEN